MSLADWRRAGAVSDQEAKAMVALARQLRQKVVAWLDADHPELRRKS